MLELDGGEGRRYNETFVFEGHQYMQVDKQEGVYAGGKAEYTGVRSYEVYGDYQKGKSLINIFCLFFLRSVELFFLSRLFGRYPSRIETTSITSSTQRNSMGPSDDIARGQAELPVQ